MTRFIRLFCAISFGVISILAITLYTHAQTDPSQTVDPLLIPQESFIPDIKLKQGNVINIDARRIRASQMVSLVQYMKADTQHTFRLENLSVSNLASFMDFLISNNIIQRVVGMKVIITDPEKPNLDEKHFIETIIPQIRHFLSLNLAVNGVSDRIVGEICRNLKKLKVLRLYGKAITDQSGQVISSELPTLIKLSLLGTSLTDAGLTPILSTLKELQELEISGELVSDRALMVIPQRLTKLKSIGFQNHKFADPQNALAFLSRFKNLVRLDLSYTNVDDSVLTIVGANNRDLKRLNISGTRISVDGLIIIVDTFPGLHFLYMENMPFGLNDDDLGALVTELKELRSIKLSSNEVTERGLSSLATLTNLEDAAILSTSPLAISKDCLIKLKEKCPNFRELQLSHQNTPNAVKVALNASEVTNLINIEYRDSSKPE